MYEQKFNFSQRPFSVCPQHEEYFPGQSHQQAIAASRSCVQRRNGPATIIGAVGTGKSLTLQVIGEVFADQFDVVSIECSRLEQRSELLQSILFGMNLPFRDMSEGELRLSLIDHLKNGGGNANGILLLVDEADRLSIELLDELRLVTNVLREGLSQAQLVLAGTQRLEESLNDPRLASFGQRIASRSYLQNFSCEEVRRYVADNIERAGGNAQDIFEDDAIDEVARASDGCPRVINQLCERSLAVCATQDQPKVSRDIVQVAWAELQNLPMPTNSNSACPAEVKEGCSHERSTDGVVEFGALDDGLVGDSEASGFADEAGEAAPEQSGHKDLSSDSQDPQPQAQERLQWGTQPNAAEEQSEVIDQDASVQGQADREGEAGVDVESSIGVKRGSDVEVEGEYVTPDEHDQPGAWSGQLPTNLGEAEHPDYESGTAWGAAETFGSGDPFAPEELPPRQLVTMKLANT